MTNVPYAEGPNDCKICFVGEAPGYDEVRYQRPFVGAAGQKLDTLLSRSGIVRQECRIDNVLQFRPAGNYVKPYIDLLKNPPFVSEIAEKNISALLERLIECKANVIVPLGGIALFALTRLKNITKRRGSILQSFPLHKEWSRPRKVIPTIHPSAALRMYEYNHFIAHDLKRIKRESEFPDIRLMKRNLILSPSFDEALEYIRKCSEFKLIAFDIEVTKEEISHVSLAVTPNDAICIPFYDEGREHFTIYQESEIWRALGKLLSNPNVTKAGQNIGFDSTFVYRKLGIVIRPIEDTMIAQQISFPDFPKGLDFIVSIHCNGEPYYKDEGKKWFKNPFATSLAFRRYSAMDSAVVMEAFPKLLSVLEHFHNIDTYKNQRNIVEPLTFMSERGINIDKEGLKKASINTEKKIGVLQKELNDIVGFELNTSSPKQVKDYFYIRKGIKPYVKKGKPTVDGKALKKIYVKGFKEADIMLELRHLRKMKGTYYDVKLDPDDGRLRCSYDPVGTKQGRPSSSETIFDVGTNLLNQPPEMQKLMKPDLGYIMLSLDLSQAENRVVAYISNETRMIKAFELGVDIHKQTAGLIFNKPIEEVSDKPGSCSIGGGKFSERFWGKKANHGLNYGEGYGTFADDYQISRREAKIIVDRYHSVYPGIRMWHSSIREQMSKNKTLINCYGRRRRFMGRWGDELFQEAYSFIPQSTIADKFNKDGICYVYYNQDLFGEVELLNAIYDSILFQVPLDIGVERMYEIIMTIKRNLETPLTWKDKEFSIPADCKIGFNAYGDVEFGHKELEDKDNVVERIRRYIDVKT